MKEIKSFESACECLGRDPRLPDYSMLEDPIQREGMEAHYKLITIADAMREKRKMDWLSNSVRKYVAWFWVVKDETKPNGVGLSYNDFDLTFTVTYVSSPFAMFTPEETKYFATEFKELFEAYMLMFHKSE